MQLERGRRVQAVGQAHGCAPSSGFDCGKADGERSPSVLDGALHGLSSANSGEKMPPLGQERGTRFAAMAEVADPARKGRECRRERPAATPKLAVLGRLGHLKPIEAIRRHANPTAGDMDLDLIRRYALVREGCRRDDTRAEAGRHDRGALGLEA